MKNIFKIFTVLAVLAMGTTSCNVTDLQLQDDPNRITPDRASVNDLYNQIQLSFRNFYSGAQGTPGALARMYHAGAFTYNNLVGPGTTNGIWGTAYNQLFPDIDALLALADERGLDIHAGSAKIMKAYTLMTMVDLMGNVPLTDAGKGTDVISPTSDPGDAVYAAAIALLDEAIEQMSGTNAGSPPVDLFYGGSATKWVTLAKTLKIRAALTTSLVDGSAGSTISSIVAGGDIIDEASEDFQFNYGNQRTNPNSRHPFYNSHYEQGDGAYLSNYFMWIVAAEKVDANDVPVADPRLRYYFYRKVDDATSQDQTTYGCHLSALPDQSAKPQVWLDVDPRLPYCYATENGYIGRDHMNGSGIPPDGPIRTSYGLYPGGGQFDIDLYVDSRKQGTTGGMGQGIWPIVLSSFTHFMLAEAALRLGTGGDAAALLETGIRQSIAKVQGFGALVPATMNGTITVRGVEISIAEAFVPDADDVDNYVNFVMGEFAAADDAGKLDIVMKEYLIAAWGNGLDAYNNWRRTGLPSNTRPGLDNPGPFPRSLLLPQVHVERNATATQLDFTNNNVFWDNNSTTLY